MANVRTLSVGIQHILEPMGVEARIDQYMQMSTLLVKLNKKHTIMKSRMLTLLFAIVVNIGITCAEIVEGTCGGPGHRWTFNTSNGEFEYFGYGLMGDPTWSQYRSAIKFIHLPEGLTSISDYAFTGSQLTSITLPESITSIGKQAFAGCTELKSVNIISTGLIIPDAVTTIGDGAFAGCKTLFRLELGKSVETIGANAFYGCEGFINVSFSESLTTIGDYAFAACTGLSTIEIPESVTYLGSYVFAACTGLTSANLPSSLKSIGASPYYNCSNLLTPIHSKTVFAYLPSSFEGKYSIPDGITHIAAYAFADCAKMTDVVIPNSVQVIANAPFINCAGLTEVHIPNSVVSIGGGLFYNCTGLIKAVIPNSVTFIDNATFYNCSSLKSAVIGDGVPQLGENTFSGCSNLTDVTIGKSISHFPNNIFKDCERLTNVVWNIKHYNNFTDTQTPFYCYERTYDGANFDIRSQIKSIIFGEEVDTIPAYLCYGLGNLNSINLPANLRSINTGAFMESGLISVSVPEGVTNIDSKAFASCVALRQINLPSTLNHIGAWAFDGTFYANKDANWEDNGLYVDNYLLSVSRYYNSYYNYNSAIFNIKEGTYLVADSAAESAHVYELDIPSSLKIIGAGAFANNSTDYYGLHELNLPSTLEYIGERAFAGNNIFSVNVPSSINHIGTDAFKGVTNLLYNGTLDGAPWGADFLNVYEESGILYESRAKTEILTSHDFKERRLVIPNSVIKIHEKAFNENYYIRSIVLGANIEEIESNALYCYYLDTIYSFLKEPIVIPNNAFGWIDFPNTLLYVPQDQLEDYYRADVWREFDVVPMIADVVPTEEEITISTTESEAIIVVELIDGATTYELTVSLLNGTLVATYTYNSQGELNSTVYHVPSRTQKDAFQFIVSGLDSGTEYQYTVVAKDEKGNIVETKKGTFETKSPMDIDNIIESSDLRNSKKILLDGQIYILRGEKTYTLTGQEVR